MTLILDASEALRLELTEIEARRLAAGLPPLGPPADGGKQEPIDRAARLKLSALCLSGGGIRSAAFCLGVLQALAAKELLNRFDYVSTVSGGGYIGGWLQLLYRAKGDPGAAQQELGSSLAAPVRRLRGFSNFLTPQTGALSADTFAGVMLYLRNLMLNWVLFLPLLLLVALAPIGYRTLLFILHDYGDTSLAMLLLATLCMGIAVYFACQAIPSHRSVDGFATPKYIVSHIVWPATAWAFLLPFAIRFLLPYKVLIPATPDVTGLVVTPSLPTVDWLAAVTGQAWLACVSSHRLIIPALYFVASCLGYAIAGCVTATRQDGRAKLFLLNTPGWVTASLVSALLIWGGLEWLYPDSTLVMAASKKLIGEQPWLVDKDTAIACFMPVWLIGMHVLHSTVYVGLRREAAFADLDREWLARLSGLLMRIGVLWTALALICLVLSVTLPGLNPVATNGEVQLLPKWITGLFATGTTLGAIAAWLGKQVSDQVNAAAAKVGGWLKFVTTTLTSTWLLSILAALFAILLLDVVAMIVERMAGEWSHNIADAPLPAWASHWPAVATAALKQWLLTAVQLLIAAIAGVAIWACHAMNPNRFSMHAVYRNRLSRAFLGSARTPRERRPDPFTGFAITPQPIAPLAPIVDDNPRLKDFRTVPAGQLLYPVINMTLNVTAGSNTAWAERQGENFIATPIVCGAAELRHPDQVSRGDVDAPLGAYVRTEQYAGADSRNDRNGFTQGIRIGSAMAISGAAISPNWGYHSSRPTALLMMLFNVRLGAWLPNPALPLPPQPLAVSDRRSRRQETRRIAAQQRQERWLRMTGPQHALATFLHELLGTTTDEKQAIYLSDGGHFENLALYEMLRRRCQNIVVVDAGQDADCQFVDLGNAIRKAEIDLGARVTMRPMRIYPRSKLDSDNPAGALGVAFGDIEYPGKATGRLVYLKPTLLRAAPADVQAYARGDDAFPHVSTLDQWFTESEFESYRALGAWQTQQVIDQMVGSEPRDFFDAAAMMCPP